MNSEDLGVIPPFGNGESFGDLFTVINKGNEKLIPFKSEAWTNYSVKPPVYHKSEGGVISGFMTVYNTVTSESDSLYVVPSESVVAWIKDNMLPIQYDKIYFKAIIFEDGRVMLYASYNLIIGSRPLAVVTLESMNQSRSL